MSPRPVTRTPAPVQTCFEQWLEKPILIPLFDDMCRIDPLLNNPCPEGETPSGQNSWYHFPTYASSDLTGNLHSGPSCSGMRYG